MDKERGEVHTSRGSPLPLCGGRRPKRAECADLHCRLPATLWPTRQGASAAHGCYDGRAHPVPRALQCHSIFCQPHTVVLYLAVDFFHYFCSAYICKRTQIFGHVKAFVSLGLLAFQAFLHKAASWILVRFLLKGSQKGGTGMQLEQIFSSGILVDLQGWLVPAKMPFFGKFWDFLKSKIIQKTP